MRTPWDTRHWDPIGPPWAPFTNCNKETIKYITYYTNNQINTVSVEELQSIIDDPKLILVDVQSKEAVEESGMIKNAIHANRGFLEFYFDQRADNPFKKIDVKSDSKIIVYCGAGGQGALATKSNFWTTGANSF